MTQLESFLECLAKLKTILLSFPSNIFGALQLDAGFRSNKWTLNLPICRPETVWFPYCLNFYKDEYVIKPLIFILNAFIILYQDQAENSFQRFNIPIPIGFLHAAVCTNIGIAGYILFSVYFPEKYNSKKLGLHLTLEYCTRFASMIHALLMASLTLYYWFSINPTFIIPQTLEFYPECVISMMTGYMVYDLFVETLTVEKHDFLILTHHLFGLLSHFLCLTMQDGVSGYFLMLVYIAESTTPFLHASWFLYRLEYQKTMLFKVLSASLLFLWIFARLIASPVIFYHFLKSENEFGEKVSIFFLHRYIMATFVCLNYFWFYKLIKVIVTPSSSSSTIDENVNTSKKVKNKIVGQKKEKIKKVVTESNQNQKIFINGQNEQLKGNEILLSKETMKKARESIMTKKDNLPSDADVQQSEEIIETLKSEEVQGKNNKKNEEQIHFRTRRGKEESKDPCPTNVSTRSNSTEETQKKEKLN